MKNISKIRWFLVLMLMAVILTGCGKTSKDDTLNQPEQDAEQQDQDENQGEQENHAEELIDYKNESLPTEVRVSGLLSQMSLMDKVGQMMQGERGNVTATDMTKLKLGSVLSGGGSVPVGNRVQDWNKMFGELQTGAMNSTLQIPMLYGVDAVHGLGLLKGAVVFPHNIGLGAANDPVLMYEMGAAVAEEMKLTNILWNFGPCVAVSADPRWGRTYESYSSDTNIVAGLADAYMKGQQDHGVASTAKHYVGDGGTSYGTGETNQLLDRGDTKISEEELRKVHLYPYEILVSSGVKIVMASFSSYNGLKMHENEYLITDILKTELGFKGFVVSDWEAMNALSGDTFEEDIALAVNAGVDMLMEPNNYKKAINALVNNVNSGKISMDRIDDAVSRILTVKFDLGLFEDPFMEKTTHEVTELGSTGYRDLAKQLVAKSQVLLKNDNSLLPLQKGKKIFVTGPARNNMGLQCGGWGLSWQGNLDTNGKITEGTTILEGLQEYADTFGLEIITDREQASQADIVILVLGEVPYAEFEGDTQDLSIIGSKADSGNKSAIEYVKGLNKPVITLLVAGRNVIIEEYMDQWDSIVMCYLPGTEGDGIASVLYGETPFTGKLPMPYYKSVDDIAMDNADLLFKVGYGLTY
ncbi:MAG: glycoside hydrolase family 3 protein [Mobilitalea sp.]